VGFHCGVMASGIMHGPAGSASWMVLHRRDSIARGRVPGRFARRDMLLVLRGVFQVYRAWVGRICPASAASGGASDQTARPAVMHIMTAPPTSVSSGRQTARTRRRAPAATLAQLLYGHVSVR
jgi:hypothetical protein